MRLINVKTLQLEEFISSQNAPPYAVLSHTWGDAEITFQQMCSADRSAFIKSGGFAKIRESCRMANTYGLAYVWVDTCCIDKSSSADLTEAINSMFQWYAQAEVCFAYLYDVVSRPDTGAAVDASSAALDAETEQAFSNCRWFTRGWALQELLAPARVEFFDMVWHPIGSKKKFAPLIQVITGIPENVLNGLSPLAQSSVAKRMSWAANRNTTRPEDAAYCLFGIFDVKLPLVYGEGERAFQRLQDAIIQQSNDLSIFAWCAKTPAQYRGLLAVSTSEFASCADIEIDETWLLRNPEYSITNKGIKISTDLIGNIDGSYLLDLRCYQQAAEGSRTPHLVYLRQAHQDVFLREKPAKLHRENPNLESGPKWFRTSRTMYAMKHVGDLLTRTLSPKYSKPFVFRKGFTEVGATYFVQRLSAEYGVDCTWYATTHCVDHQYNQQRTLLSSPLFGKATCTVTITTYHQTSYSHYDNPKTNEKLTLYMWMGMAGEDKPWIYCSFEDLPASHFGIGPGKPIVGFGGLRAAAQTSVRANNGEGPGRPPPLVPSGMPAFPRATLPNTGAPANLVLRLSLDQSEIDDEKVVFIDLSSVHRTRIPLRPKDLNP